MQRQRWRRQLQALAYLGCTVPRSGTSYSGTTVMTSGHTSLPTYQAQLLGQHGLLEVVVASPPVLLHIKGRGGPVKGHRGQAHDMTFKGYASAKLLQERTEQQHATGILPRRAL